jgi:hypothetical protein
MDVGLYSFKKHPIKFGGFMRKVHCDGCGFTESDDLPRSKKKIEPATITIVEDSRAPEGTKRHNADLCPNCQALLLHTYFKVPMNDKLELAVPTFIIPEELEETPEPQSLKA